MPDEIAQRADSHTNAYTQGAHGRVIKAVPQHRQQIETDVVYLLSLSSISLDVEQLSYVLSFSSFAHMFNLRFPRF